MFLIDNWYSPWMLGLPLHKLPPWKRLVTVHKAQSAAMLSQCCRKVVSKSSQGVAKCHKVAAKLSQSGLSQSMSQVVVKLSQSKVCQIVTCERACKRTCKVSCQLPVACRRRICFSPSWNFFFVNAQLRA